MGIIGTEWRVTLKKEEFLGDVNRDGSVEEVFEQEVYKTTDKTVAYDLAKGLAETFARAEGTEVRRSEWEAYHETRFIVENELYFLHDRYTIYVKEEDEELKELLTE